MPSFLPSFLQLPTLAPLPPLLSSPFPPSRSLARSLTRLHSFRRGQEVVAQLKGRKGTTLSAFVRSYRTFNIAAAAAATATAMPLALTLTHSLARSLARSLSSLSLSLSLSLSFLPSLALPVRRRTWACAQSPSYLRSTSFLRKCELYGCVVCGGGGGFSRFHNHMVYVILVTLLVYTNNRVHVPTYTYKES